MIAGMTVNSLPAPHDVVAEPLAAVLWNVRGLDMAAQIVLIFAGVMGVLGLLSVSDDIVRVRASRVAHHPTTTDTTHVTAAPEIDNSMIPAPLDRLEKEPV